MTGPKGPRLRTEFEPPDRMTGPQHYQRSLDLAASAVTYFNEGDMGPAAVLAQLATAHATLAHAAATALTDAGDRTDGGMPHADYRAWKDAAGTQGDT